MRRPPRRAHRLRRSSALVAWPRGEWLVLRNFVLGSTTACSPVVAAAVLESGGETTVAALARRLRRAGDRDPSATLDVLVEAGILVVPGSRLGRDEAAWRRAWRWGPLAAAFHRELRDVEFQPVAETARMLRRKARRHPSPVVIPEPGPGRTPLPPPRVGRGALAHLARRESLREMSGDPIGARDVADVLFAGFGVRAILRDPIQGELPLKLAPSGGARNPIDGYLLALDVKGIPPGAYRYSGLRREIEPVAPMPRQTPTELLGGQPWADGAAAIVFLVASLGRSMWKYEHPLSLRMVLLEAGHIAQNMLVAASGAGLAGWPSGAISDSLAEQALGVGGPDRAVIYAVVLGVPLASSARLRAVGAPGAPPGRRAVRSPGPRRAR